MTTTPNKIVILGAGYGGLRAALKLEKLLKKTPNWKITLIDTNDSHQLRTELHEVAAGRTSPQTIAIPIARLIKNKNITFQQAEATHIDFARQYVTTTKAKNQYDKLIIAMGSETEFFGIPGMSKNAYTLSSVQDATRIKTHIRDKFSEAKTETDRTKKQAALTVVVGGGGFTGVELATELVDYFKKLCNRLQINPSDTQLVVVEGGATVLPGFDPELIERAQKAIRKKNIKLILKTPCVSFENDCVILKTGEKIQTGTVIWTGGVRACDLVAESGLHYGPRSRVVVNPFLESVDHPGVYVIGDNALVMDPATNRPLAPTAQLALQQAEIAALNIYAEIKGAKRTRYKPKIEGQFVSLGDRDAVGWIWKLKVSGLIAWLLKRATVVRYLFSLGGLGLLIPRLLALFSSSSDDF